MKPTSVALGLVVLGSAFVWAPLELVQANDELGWPRWQSPLLQAAGALLVAAGVGVVLVCSRVFRRTGGGTPVPIEPPAHLVASGPYRYSRNPIYVADVAILLGFFALSGVPTLLLYALAVAAGLHAFVVWLEEPQLRRRFGVDYARYLARVPRWLGPARVP